MRSSLWGRLHPPTGTNTSGLTLEQVRALEEGRELAASDQRSQREVLNYFAGLRFIEKNTTRKRIRHSEVFELHRLLADEVMEQGQAGHYRTVAVGIGDYVPPPPAYRRRLPMSPD